MSEIKLPRLPDRTAVKITVNLSPDLHVALEGYGRFYAETYGQAEPVTELIPAILVAFLAADKGFVRWRRELHHE